MNQELPLPEGGEQGSGIQRANETVESIWNFRQADWLSDEKLVTGTILRVQKPEILKVFRVDGALIDDFWAPGKLYTYIEEPGQWCWKCDDALVGIFEYEKGWSRRYFVFFNGEETDKVPYHDVEIANPDPGRWTRKHIF